MATHHLYLSRFNKPFGGSSVINPLASYGFDVLKPSAKASASSRGGGAGRCGLRLSAASAVGAADLGCTHQVLLELGEFHQQSYGGNQGNQMEVTWHNEKTDDVIFRIHVVIEHYINVIVECDDWLWLAFEKNGGTQLIWTKLPHGGDHLRWYHGISSIACPFLTGFVRLICNSAPKKDEAWTMNIGTFILFYPFDSLGVSSPHHSWHHVEAVVAVGCYWSFGVAEMWVTSAVPEVWGWVNSWWRVGLLIDWLDMIIRAYMSYYVSPFLSFLLRANTNEFLPDKPLRLGWLLAILSLIVSYHGSWCAAESFDFLKWYLMLTLFQHIMTSIDCWNVSGWFSPTLDVLAHGWLEPFAFQLPLSKEGHSKSPKVSGLVR